MAIDKGARNTYLVVALVLALVGLVLANLVGERAFKRLDLTAEGRYSLSTPFMTILGRLEDDVKLTYYTSGPRGTWFEQLQRDILDKLGDVKTASHGRVQLEVIDPLEDKEARKRLRAEGLEFQVPTQEKDKVSVSTVFSSPRVTYSSKPSILIPVIQRAEDIEYEVASRLVELMQEHKPIIAIMAPKPDQQMAMMMRRQPQSGYEWVLRQEPESKRFEVRDVELTANSPIPDKTALLLLIRPSKLGERARYEVVKYLAEGGHVLLVASPFRVSQEFGWRVEKTPTGLEDYLKEIGLEWKPDFVCDESSARLTSLDLATGMQQNIALPFYVQVTQENVDQSCRATRYLPNLVMPFPAAMTLDAAKAKSDGLSLEILARTSRLTWFEPYTETFDPRAVMERKPTRYEGSQPVFAKFEGQFPFPWQDKAAPAWDKSESDEAKADEKKDEKKEESKAAVSKKPGALLVWSCPESFHSGYMQGQETRALFQGNADALVNIAEAYSLGPELTQLRQKRYETRAIQRLAGEGQDALRNLLKAALIGAVPLMVVLFAVARWLVRRGAQLRYERRFAQTTGPSSFTP